MKTGYEELMAQTREIFTAAGCGPEEADRVAHHLLEANLTGHDSHGVIRIPSYVEWLRAGKVLPNKTASVVLENEAIAVVDGEFGLGQSVGDQAVRLGVAKSRAHGVSVIALRNSGHLGRIGEWALIAARAGRISLHWVNTSGAGILVAPFGGINRRVSANPIAAGVPLDGAEPLILDISACTIAEGKIRVARNKGVPVPDGCLIDGRGRPTNDPDVFYNDPGAILPIAGHKGYGLGIIAEMLAGALTGGSCSNPENAGRVANGMLSIYLDPAAFGRTAEFAAEAQRFVEWVKSSETVTPDGEILMPGEIEQRNRARHLRDGIELDATTWGQIEGTAASLGVRIGALQG
jgi:hydroxycarboxylate dehydrogenase B